VKWQVLPWSVQVAGGGALGFGQGVAAWLTVSGPADVIQVTVPLHPLPVKVNGLIEPATGPARVAVPNASGAFWLGLLRFAAAAFPVTVARSVSVPVVTVAELEHAASARAATAAAASARKRLGDVLIRYLRWPV
jgi:hypothetical protein